MIHEHRFDGKNSVHIYELKHKGKGEYYFRGILPGFKEGDSISKMPVSELTFKELISQNDSKGIFANPENGKQSLIEAIFVDPNWTEGCPVLHV